MFTFSFLLCGYFSVVLCTEYLTGWKGMQIPKPLPTPCISLVAGVDVVAHVEDEVVEVWEEVVIHEVVTASSHASALPKNLIAPLPYRITRGGVPEACCPFSRCTPEGGMEKTCLVAQCSGTMVRNYIVQAG